MRYQLVLQFPSKIVDDFDEVIGVEYFLAESFAEDHILDGHDFGSTEINLFIHTDNAEVALEQALLALPSKFQLCPVAAYREIIVNKYTLLWPKGYSNAFQVI